MVGCYYLKCVQRMREQCWRTWITRRVFHIAYVMRVNDTSNGPFSHSKKESALNYILIHFAGFSNAGNTQSSLLYHITTGGGGLANFRVGCAAHSFKMEQLDRPIFVKTIPLARLISISKVPYADVF